MLTWSNISGICAALAFIFIGASAAFAQTSANSATAAAEAQNSSGIIGQITGQDISIIGPASKLASGAAQSVGFAGGDTIIVHDGQARVEFTSGGELDICGPAKFTVLASGESLTIAVSFGRLHGRFDASRPVSIYSPLVVATPLAVMDQPRDFTIDVPSSGPMCVIAAQGAVQMQQQFSGSATIIPQPSNVLISGPLLSTSPAPAGSCGCDFNETAAKNAAAPAPVSDAATAPGSPVANPIVPAKTSKVSPPAPAEQIHTAPTPQVTPAAKASSRTVVMPPIIFHEKVKRGARGAGEVDAPEETISVATLLLAKDVQIEPAWIFHGEVVSPGEATKNSKLAAAKKKEGFWGRLRDWFIGRKRQT